ncbi:MAG TPA: hypothetical protein PLA68_12320, partial [Panacibacter sp.]|nr:hypothetical protein [Panacibacter sp.]
AEALSMIVPCVAHLYFWEVMQQAPYPAGLIRNCILKPVNYGTCELMNLIPRHKRATQPKMPQSLLPGT